MPYKFSEKLTESVKRNYNILYNKNISSKEANRIIGTFIKSVSNLLEEGEKVTIYNFGTFSFEKRGGYKKKSYLPKFNGQEIEIKEKLVVSFRPSKLLNNKITEALKSIFF